MDLPEDIRQALESDGDKDLIMEVITLLRGDGVRITPDLITAIRTTLRVAEGIIE